MFQTNYSDVSYYLEIPSLFSVAERPQHMLMRVSVGIHKEDIDAAIETYNLLSEKWFTHASPTLFNAGTNRPQLSRHVSVIAAFCCCCFLFYYLFVCLFVYLFIFGFSRQGFSV